MQILVTGGAGFIGSSLVDFLLLKDYSIICLDNFDDYYSSELKWNNLKQAISNSNFKLIEGDIRNEKLLNEIFSQNKIELVVHLAAKVGVHHSINNPSEYLDVNVNGTECLLNAMRINKCKNLIFSSSSSVYGDRIGAFSESDPTEIQISPYALSKKKCEVLINDFAKKIGMNSVILRFFSVYGERQRPDLVIHKIFNAIRNNQAVEIFGDGSNSRDYTNIKDVVFGIYSSILFSLNSNCINETFNIGNSQPLTMKKLLSLIMKLTKVELKVDYLPFREGDVKSTCADITKARRILNYSPNIKTKEGLKKYYNNSKYH